MFSEKEVLELKPTFKFAGITMTDWFVTFKGHNYFSIKNGLRHVDGETKSPYYFDYKAIGEDAENEALEKFTLWWLSFEK